jgi:hypothetical protein
VVAPPVSVKDRRVVTREQVLNIPIACRSYGSPAVDRCLVFAIASLVGSGEKLV